MTLTEFLLARIAEDEAAAMAAHRESMRGHAGPGFVRSRVEWAAQAKDVRGHELIERITPARVLAECEAKKRIVDLHHEGPAGSCEACSGEYLPCSTLRILATVYADHPDYDEEWRP